MKRTVLKAMVIAIVLLGALSTGLRAAEQPATTTEKRELFRKGARLWPVYCNYCHNARPAGEFSPLQWDTIMLHMRVRANLPAGDARAIREYLEAPR
jgi:mono/diheme cytochrome c family protein